jgi:uncharacterized MAPEG superfamily protein
MLTMTAEIYWLILTLALTGLLWVPYILQLIFQMGPIKAMQDPTGLHPHEPEWPRRATRAHSNAVENLAVFAPLTLLVVLMGLNTETTALAAMVFFFARLGHYVVYTLGAQYLRTIIFAVGFFCQVVMALPLLGLL